MRPLGAPRPVQWALFVGSSGILHTCAKKRLRGASARPGTSAIPGKLRNDFRGYNLASTPSDYGQTGHHRLIRDTAVSAEIFRYASMLPGKRMDFRHVTISRRPASGDRRWGRQVG